MDKAREEPWQPFTRVYFNTGIFISVFHIRGDVFPQSAHNT